MQPFCTLESAIMKKFCCHHPYSSSTLITYKHEVLDFYYINWLLQHALHVIMVNKRRNEICVIGVPKISDTSLFSNAGENSCFSNYLWQIGSIGFLGLQKGILYVFKLIAKRLCTTTKLLCDGGWWVEMWNGKWEWGNGEMVSQSPHFRLYAQCHTLN